MLYRKIPNIEQELSILGFGCMRFPTKADGTIDEPKAGRMLRTAFERGVNYFDTAWPYHNGKSEEFVGRTLANVRDKITLVTKLPAWMMKTKKDLNEILDKQLAALKTDYIDIYLFHGMSKDRWKILEPLEPFEFLERAKKSGKIRHTGFSFHDGLDMFKKLVDAYSWDVCQIQYNLLDRNFQAGTEGMKYAAEKGLGVVVMEPLKGGIISRPVPDELKTKAANIGYKAPNFADLGLRWVWDQPEVSVVLSGMTELEQLKQNLVSAENGHVGNLSRQEHELADSLRDFLAGHMKVHCTGCSYCMPCPQSVGIPWCFSTINNAALTGDWNAQKQQYYYLMSPERGVKKASACVECGACIAKCPQHINIPEKLKEVAQAFES